MSNLKTTFTKGIAFATACLFSAATISCTAQDAPPTGQARITVTTPDGQVEARTGTWDEIVGPLTVDLAPFEADGHATTDPAALLQASRSVFHHPDGHRVLIIVRDGQGALSVSSESSLVSPFRISWDNDLALVTVETPDGPAQVRLENVPMSDRGRVVGSIAATTLALGDSTFIRGEHAGVAPVVAPIVLIFAIVFGSWLACVTLGTAICAGMCYLQCKDGVQSSVMNCGVNISPGTGGSGSGGGALGTCSCNCNPPPAPTPAPTPAPSPTGSPTGSPTPTTTPTPP